MSISNYVLYEAYGNSHEAPERIEANWVNKPNFLVLNESYTCFIDVYIPTEEDVPISNFCPRFLIPGSLCLNIAHHDVETSPLQYVEDLVLKETTRLGRFAFSFTPTAVGRFSLNLVYQQVIAWTCQIHILDSWAATERGEINGPLLYAKVAGGFFGQRTLDNRSFFIISTTEQCYVGVADLLNKAKTWSALVNPGITKLEVMDKQIILLTVSQIGTSPPQVPDKKIVKVDVKQFCPYVKLKQGQEVRFLNIK